MLGLKKMFACFHQSSNEQSHEEKNGEEKLLPEDKRRIWEDPREAEKEERGNVFD